MKQSLLLICIFSCFYFKANAQAEGDGELNILRSPISPAANVLGISPSDVQRPSDPSALMVSLQNARGASSILPASYAVDIAPAWLFWGQNIDFRDFIDSTSVGKSIRQTFLLSSAFTSITDSSDKNASLGLGLKFSILRGAVSWKTLAAVAASGEVLSEINTKVTAATSLMVASPEFENASPTQQVVMLDSLNRAVHNRESALAAQLLALAKDLDFTRHGWKLDFSGGMAINFPGQVYNDGKISRAGAWFTGGYEGTNGFAMLALARYLYNPDKIFADNTGLLLTDNLHTMDAGLRFLYDGNNKFTMGGEFIYRSVITRSDVKSTYRYTINADYRFRKNQILTLSLGRDYDGTFNKDGNLIAALNVVFGLGNKR